MPNEPQLVDLANLTLDQIDQLKAVLGSTGGVNRSPGFKPLRDMRAPTTAKGRLNRPHFEWSADDDGQTVIKPYPRLYWDEGGVERRVETAEADKLTPAAWMPYPPMKAAIVAPMVKMQAEFDALSPEDQEFVIAAQKKARLNKLHELMSGLSGADLATLKPRAVEKKKSA